MGANDYGSAAGVGALTPRFAGAGKAFDTNTNPPLAMVETWINQMSGIVNSMLAQEGFKIPVAQVDVKFALDHFVNEEVASMVEGVNNAGRFGPTAKAPGKRGRFAVLTEDAKAFIEGNAYGFELMGATRTVSVFASAAAKEVDANGNEMEPYFKRGDYGNQT